MNAKPALVRNEDRLQHHLGRSHEVKRRPSSLSRDPVRHGQVSYVGPRPIARGSGALRERVALVAYDSRANS